MTAYGRSLWIDSFPKSRVPSYPRYRDASSTDVVVVGGGLTGCTIAYALAASGIKTMVLEADQIGRGATARSIGYITDDPGVSFADIEKLHGLRAARRVWQAWRRAALDFAALLRRLEIKCQLDPHPTTVVATTVDQLKWLQREMKSRKGAGLDAVTLNPRVIQAEVAVPALGGFKVKDGAAVDPYRACIGLAAAAASRRAAIFERSPVLKVTFDRKAADVVTEAGSIHASRVVIATGAQTPLWRSLARHFRFRSAYTAVTEPVPARLRKQLGARRSVLRDLATPPHIVRWLGDERLLVSGADQDLVAARHRDKAIVQRTGQLMYELTLFYPEISGIPAAYGWDASYASAADGLPYIGPHRNYPHHVFALGESGRSLTSSYLASRIVLRHVSGELDQADEVFGFLR